MSAKPITFTYPRDNTCAINLDFEGIEYILQWNGDWREIPDLAKFPSVVNATVTPVPHSSNVNEIWKNSQVLNFGSDSHLRVLHPSTDEYPICKVATDARQRTLIQEEFYILRHLELHHAPVVRTHQQPLVDEEGIFGFRMELLNPIDGKVGAKYILALTEAVDAIHRAGIIHHDLSPSKLMLNQQGLIRVIDFGRAGYVGMEIPKCKRIWNESATNFSTDADLLTLDKTIGWLKRQGKEVIGFHLIAKQSEG